MALPVRCPLLLVAVLLFLHSPSAAPAAPAAPVASAAAASPSALTIVGEVSAHLMALSEKEQMAVLGTVMKDPELKSAFHRPHIAEALSGLQEAGDPEAAQADMEELVKDPEIEAVFRKLHGMFGLACEGGDASSTTTKTCRAKRERAEAEAGAAIGGAGSAPPTAAVPLTEGATTAANEVNHVKVVNTQTATTTTPLKKAMTSKRLARDKKHPAGTVRELKCKDFHDFTLVDVENDNYLLQVRAELYTRVTTETTRFILNLHLG